MPDLQYGLNTVERDRGNMPKIPVINMFVEKNDAEPNPVLQSRPGLVNTGTVLGTGPITALYQIDGVLSDQLFGVSGGHFYSGGVDKGAINGVGPARIAGFSNRVFACAGTDVWQYDGTTLSSIAGLGFSVTSICVGTDRLILVDQNTGHFYWSNVLSNVIDPLSFATAEQSPDNLKDCLFIGDTLMLFGSETVEFWPASSVDPNLPYAPLIGRTFQVGVRGTGCVSPFTTTFAWITNHNKVCVGNPQTEISSPSLEEKITNSLSASLWRFFLEGMEFLSVRLDNETWVFNASSSTWSTFQSYGKTNWIPQCYANGYFGSSVDGHVITWSADHSDFGDVLERRFRAGYPLTNNTLPVFNLTLRCNPGQTPFLTGTNASPVVELRTSKNGGFTWGLWRDRTLGINGQYRANVMWRSLGFYGFPSFLAEVRVTDPVPFRVSGVTINESFAGTGDEDL